MPDREKIISLVEEAIEIVEKEACWTIASGLRDALAMLKEQEAVEAYEKHDVWMCGNCDKEVVGWEDPVIGGSIRYPYCRQCGRAVKWND